MRHYQTSDNRNDRRNNMQPQGRSASNANFGYNRQNQTQGQNRSQNQPINRNTEHGFNASSAYTSSRQQPIESCENEQRSNTSNPLEQIISNPSGLFKSILNFIPSGIYNRETKKILGLFTAEDLLLTALIIMLADSDDNDDTALLIALVYILMG